MLNYALPGLWVDRSFRRPHRTGIGQNRMVNVRWLRTDELKSLLLLLKRFAHTNISRFGLTRVKKQPKTLAGKRKS